ncbi:adenylate kinase [Rhodococcus sp. NPDC059968]|uniref:adenylate kinase n=1 Tax=Rhodococcus sp. NPDC059968 TaxID=3347017 RepID=UPI003671C71C
MRVVLCGPPGAGKGTQAKLLSEYLAVPHISTGDLFRANIGEGTPLGATAKQHLDAGDLVPPELTIAMVRGRLSDPDTAAGFLLDGFPRSVMQANALLQILSGRGEELDSVVEFRIDSDDAVQRMLERGRVDDTEDVIRNRLEVYRAETLPLLDFYAEQLVTVDAVGEVSEVNDRTLKALLA